MVGGVEWGAGPIPACAGQPAYHEAGRTPGGAYPRVCGATNVIVLAVHLDQGLSPRVRGNLAPPTDEAQIMGPIPACAGQPIWESE